jgi:hypothetical protein
MNNTPWIDTRLNEEEMKFLNIAISEENKENHSKLLVGHITKSETLNDKNNWFYKNVLKKHTERMFYDDWDNYREYHIVKEHPPPNFQLDAMWVNYQKQHEFNPIHNHSGLYSFVIFMKIPTHWKEQHDLPISDASPFPCTSDFQFIAVEQKGETWTCPNITLSAEDEGRMLFFPASTLHQVYPFYGTEEERITISGNVSIVIPKKIKVVIPTGEYEDTKEQIEILERHVISLKNKLKMMKKIQYK